MEGVLKLLPSQHFKSKKTFPISFFFHRMVFFVRFKLFVKLLFANSSEVLTSLSLGASKMNSHALRFYTSPAHDYLKN